MVSQLTSGFNTQAAPIASPILKTYRARTRKSAALFEAAQRVMPGGNSRQASFWTPHPLAIERAEGVHLFDVDGRRYLDMINNYTSMVHGHAYPPIVAAAERQIRRGTGWAAGNRMQNRLAEQIVARIPSVDQVRFTNSGTEAVALAFTIARKITGRRKLLMARYGYHGSLMEFETGSFGHEGPITYLAAFNDLANFKAVLAKHGNEIAAVFLEPVLGSGGVIPATPEFLKGVKAAAHHAGALFILDEVLSFRFATGGCQEHFGIKPDLTMLGKAIGGGFPVGAVGGMAEFMKVFDPADLKVFHTGTYNANTVTMAAGDVAVRELTGERIAVMHGLAEKLKDGLIRAVKKAGLPVSVNHFGSCLNLYFSAAAPESSIVREDTKIMGMFHHAALNHGLFLAPRGMMALSTVMTDAHIDEALERAGAALKDVAAEVQL